MHGKGGQKAASIPIPPPPQIRPASRPRRCRHGRARQPWVAGLLVFFPLEDFAACDLLFFLLDFFDVLWVAALCVVGLLTAALGSDAAPALGAVVGATAGVFAVEPGALDGACA